MDKLFYVAIGFILGLATCLYIGITVITGKLNKQKVKEVWTLFFEEKE